MRPQWRQGKEHCLEGKINVAGQWCAWHQAGTRSGATARPKGSSWEQIQFTSWEAHAVRRRSP